LFFYGSRGLIQTKTTMTMMISFIISSSPPEFSAFCKQTSDKWSNVGVVKSINQSINQSTFVDITTVHS